MYCGVISLKKVKLLTALLLCLSLLLPLWGCAGRELYDRLLIHGIGVDAAENGYVVTVRSSVSPEDEGEEYFRCEGQTVLEALNSLSRSTGRQPFYAHNYLVVFGRECARQGLDRCLDFFVRYYNTRPAVRMYLAENRAEDILSFQKDGKYLKMSELQQLGDSSRDTGSTVRVEILDFVNGVKRQGSSPVLPVLRQSDSGVEIVSTAYFDGFRLKGALSLKETRGYLAVKNRLEKGEAVIRGETFGTATFSLSGVSGAVQADRDPNGEPAFSITLRAEADLSAASGEGSLSANWGKMEQALAEELRQEAESAIEQAVILDRCDIFGFGAMLYRNDPAYWETVAENWKNQMAACRYTVRAEVKISRLEQETGGFLEER